MKDNMDVTELKTQRKSLRTSFTLSAKVIEEELMKVVPDGDELSILKMQISDKFSRLEKCQRAEKFDGNVKEYLTFWGQFKKIHEDESLPNDDKFQYLLQAVVSNSKAARVVESFLATAENYPKAIAQLQERFGRKDLLVQIYVRDLLSMVMRNAAPGRSKTDLSALYDELKVKVRALESLGRTQDKYGKFLSPLVESCLPEDILLVFERSKNFKEDTPAEGWSLKLLMNFLKEEVKKDEMVELARNNFSAPVNHKKKEVNKPDKFSSAATLVSTHDRNGTVEQQPMRARNYYAYPNIRNHWALRCMNGCPYLVVCLKRDLQCLRPQASLVLIYRPNAAGMKCRVDLAHPSRPVVWKQDTLPLDPIR
ncbi:DUF1758 domain-containing protein [Trichonephila clavipes]|nr:DUF1758 domain-containing protein [Trichonephila clavipes]